MDVTITWTSTKIKEKNYNIIFNFDKFVETYTEVEAYNFLSLVADLGGYLGLTLGLSLYDMVTPLTGVLGRLMNWMSKKSYEAELSLG